MPKGKALLLFIRSSLKPFLGILRDHKKIDNDLLTVINVGK